MSLAAGVVFKTSEEVDFVLELAGWASLPAGEQPAADDVEEGAQPEASAFQVECAGLEEKKDFEQLSLKLVAALKERFASQPEQDVECAYAILLQLWVTWEMLPGKLLSLAEELCSNTAERPVLRRTLLLSLYSLVQQYALLDLRFPMLLKLVKYCSAASLLDSILGGPAKRVATVEDWIREWELSDAQKTELWGLVFDAYADDAAATYENALKYLPLHDGSSSLSAQPELRTRLVQSVLMTLKSPELFNSDKLAQLAIVQQLGKDAEFSLLSRLLQIFAREMYDEYLKFYSDAKSKAFMEKHGLSHEACARKMRLLSLVSLGQANKELSYDTIASALQIEKDLVETWVMEAIDNGLVGAKMDQVHEQVVVSVCLEREFGKQQWQRLKGSLSEWGDSVQGLLQVVVESRPNLNQ